MRLFSGSFCQIYRVTDEALIAKTAVWPNFFLMTIFYMYCENLNKIVEEFLKFNGHYTSS